VIVAKYGMARPYLTPPGLPAERLPALRASFDTRPKNAEFLATAEKQRLEINPMSGLQIEALVNRIFSTPAPLPTKAREAIQPTR
jgi:tripartite-type tricarboxylate transporter receptor subunit TctC